MNIHAPVASTVGYIVDIEFVHAPATDAFTAVVDPSRWEDAGNWSGGDVTACMAARKAAALARAKTK